MRRLYIIIITFFFIPEIASAQWTSTSVSGGNIESIYFFDASHGVASGLGAVIQTHDGGNSWTEASADFGIRDIDFTDSTHGFAAGVSGQALKKTTNGGVTWTALTPVNSNSLWGVSVTPSKIYVCGTGGVVWKSSNNGSSFSAVNLPTVSDLAEDIDFVSDNTGCVLDQKGIIYKTTNGGTSWQNVYSESTFVNFTSIFFVDANNGFAVGGKGTFVKTTDGGDSWTKLSTPATVVLEYVHFYDPNNGIAAGDSGTVIITHDGGTTWDKQSVGTIHCYSCYMLTPNSAIVGATGKMYKNTNLAASSGNVVPSVSVLPSSIYPVPFSNSFIVKVPGYSGSLNFELYSITGSRVLSKLITAPETTIETHMLQPETYFYILRKESKIVASGKTVKIQ